jgi:hypothetical protein
VQAYGMKPDQALEHVREKRPHIWLRDKQLKSIDDYYKKFGLGSNSPDNSSSEESSSSDYSVSSKS